MKKVCLLSIFLTINNIYEIDSNATAFETKPFEKELETQGTIELIDPVTENVVKTFEREDYRIETEFETYLKEITEWVHSFANGSETKIGYNKPIILDRIDEDGSIIKGKSMVVINEKELVEKIVERLFTGGKIELPLLYIKSGYDAEDVPHLHEVALASYTTYFNGANIGRSKNIELSSIAINNVIVGSGDIFSFNTTVGPRDVTTGYQEAPEIVRGKLVMGIGGGICQTSSTLFNAIDQLDVKTIERHHHSKDVKYVPRGRDATVSFGGLDYRFQNTTGIPLLIKTYYSRGSLTVQIKTSKEYADLFKYELRN
ncbi:VanW family protein [Lysinibacillus telephonicus]|uniref:VanW family protein n=2 Tax=Lysinibacillus telephonicus TaxID=1714840 RepID=A0A3S0JNB8_9BACI|nr:VanW family protein [Lysinibacillus telephonicus]RTQ91934.1 hypothetical protein EKG35_12555 [Lysinibacillus telephonicus]